MQEVLIVISNEITNELYKHSYRICFIQKGSCRISNGSDKNCSIQQQLIMHDKYHLYMYVNV